MLWPRRQRVSDQRLIEAAETLSRTIELSENEQVSALKNRGFDEGQAWRLATLLPLAFSRPVLEDLGVTTFVTEVTATDADGKAVTADLMRQPEYIAGLRLARRHRRSGNMDHEVYKRIVNSSAEIDTASKAINDGEKVRGATIASALVGSEIARHLIR